MHLLLHIFLWVVGSVVILACAGRIWNFFAHKHVDLYSDIPRHARPFKIKSDK